MNTYHLIPTDSHKSFYGKATVIENDNGVIELMSYSTVVAAITPDHVFHRTWSGWSATTGRHIASFAQHYGYGRMNKAAYCSLPYEGIYSILNHWTKFQRLNQDF